LLSLFFLITVHNPSSLCHSKTLISNRFFIYFSKKEQGREREREVAFFERKGKGEVMIWSWAHHSQKKKL